MKISFQLCLFSAPLLALGAAPAAAADIAGPVTGYVFDAPSHSVLPVLGIPGAATLGDPVSLGLDITYAAVAPGQDYLLAVGTDGQAWLVRPDAATAQAGRLDLLHGAPQRIVFSPRGSAALFLQDSTADVYTGLPGSPALARTLALRSLSPSSAFAVSDDGSAVLGATGDALSVAGPSAEWKALPGVGTDASVAFSPGSSDAAVASRSANTVTLLRSPASGGERSAIAGPADGIAGPVGIAFTADGRILVANSDKGTVSILSPSGDAPAAVTCGCTPTGLSAMGRVFRLNDRTDAPIWLVDAGADQPRALFIPALQSSPAAGNGGTSQ